MKFDIYFLGLPYEMLQITTVVISKALEKCKKECVIV